MNENPWCNYNGRAIKCTSFSNSCYEPVPQLASLSLSFDKLIKIDGLLTSLRLSSSAIFSALARLWARTEPALDMSNFFSCNSRSWDENLGGKVKSSSGWFAASSSSSSSPPPRVKPRTIPATTSLADCRAASKVGLPCRVTRIIRTMSSRYLMPGRKWGKQNMHQNLQTKDLKFFLFLIEDLFTRRLLYLLQAQISSTEVSEML